MKLLFAYDRLSRLGLLSLCLLASMACSQTAATHSEIQTVVVSDSNSMPTVPGVVQYVWEEPMVDVIDVPPGLDPEGHYYRPAHQEVIQIRQGRWNYYKAKQ